MEQTASMLEAGLDLAELRCVVAGSLPADMAALPGAVLMSPLSVVRPCPVYLMGLNPGGNPAKVTRSITDAVPPREGASSYTHECWNPFCGLHCEHLRDDGLLPEHLVDHQTRVGDLARLLGYSGPADMPSANLVFARSEDWAQLKASTGWESGVWANACWPVHQHLLGIVRPRVIISLGYGLETSPLGFIKWMMPRAMSELRDIRDGTRRWGRVAECRIDTPTGPLATTVVGIPHPSRHPSPTCVVDALQALLAS